jgi:type II restriction enzyme
MCAFEDLSVTDEFLELIYHEKIGVGIFKAPEKQVEKAAEVEDTSVQTDAEEASHLRIQYLLVKIGLMRGHDVWVASNDRGKSYQGEAFSAITLDNLPQFAGPVTMHTAKAIDVIWFKKRTAQPVCFFEIEHTTSMYSGLLRLNDVKTDYPIPLAFVIAPKERRSMFDNQIVRRTFAQSELGEVCQFMDYEQVEALLKSHKTIIDILP